MILRCWGSRGSIPVSGKEYLVYGGDTTCLEIRTRNDAVIIVDAGTGLRRLGNQLLAEGRFEYDFVFTHAHWDHLMGFPFFRPLYLEKTRIRMQGCPFARQYVEKLISRVMAPPNFPIKPTDLRAQMAYEPACPTEFSVDSLSIVPVSLSHPNRGSGYRFTEDGGSLVFLTDNELDFKHPGGLSFKEYRDFAQGADFLIHDAEYTAKEYENATKGWGHSAIPRALELGAEAGVKKLGLFHHNQDRTDEQINRIVEQCREFLAKQGSAMECMAVARDDQFIL